MDWSALIGRGSPSLVVDDVHCVGCGYNLRGAGVGGACPECGGRVAESLWRLARPDTVALAVRSIGNSYLGLLAILLAPLTFADAGFCAGWFGAGILVITAVIRVVGVADLRFKAATDKLPVVGQRISTLWILALIDAALTVAWPLPLVAAEVTQASGTLRTLAYLLFAAWTCSTFATAAAACWMGSALATLLRYDEVAERLRLYWIMQAAAPLVIGGVVFAALVLSSVSGAGAAAFMIGVAALTVAIVWLGAIGFNLSGLAQLAAVAERSRDAREDVVV